MRPFNPKNNALRFLLLLIMLLGVTGCRLSGESTAVLSDDPDRVLTLQQVVNALQERGLKLQDVTGQASQSTSQSLEINGVHPAIYDKLYGRVWIYIFASKTDRERGFSNRNKGGQELTPHIAVNFNNVYLTYFGSDKNREETKEKQRTIEIFEKATGTVPIPYPAAL